jgi:two-component system, chemotaxis family, protein-glutamate methylesterase/glutaminase
VTMRKVRVLVVDDSMTVRKRIVETLASDPGFEVIGEACDGRAAIEMCQKLRPDVVTLDMVMPVMSGLAATEYIMAYCPTPIVIVSASWNRGELFKTLDALAAGAVDVLDKPTATEDDTAWERRLRQTVRTVAKVKVITHPRARLSERNGAARPVDAPEPRAAGHRLVVIGASTGGPGALMRILSSLPKQFPLPIIIVIHIDRPFDASFAEWLDGVSSLRVKAAVDGAPLPRPGVPQVLLAPAGRHLVLEGGRLRLTDDPERHSCRPSIDHLFESVARELGDQAVGCLLTGMGADGAAGLLAMRRAGAYTIAQDEETSVVFGMPREAIMRGAATRIAGLDAIGPALTQLAGRTS